MAVQRLIRIEDEGAYISLIGKRATVDPSEKSANIADHRESRDQRSPETHHSKLHILLYPVN